MKTFAILSVVGLLTLAVGSFSGNAQTFSTLYTFDTKTNSQGGNIDGTFPNSIVAGSDGNLYGTTAGGGTNGSGTAFKLTTEGTLTVLYTFCNTIVCPGAPEQPNGIVEGNDGNFYGTTEFGGANGSTESGGAVFKLTPQGTLSTLYSFCSDVVSGICIDGSVPKVPLIQGSDGNFYGTTTGGGSNDEGTVFQITPQGMLTTIYQIPNSLAVGQINQVPLCQGSDSNFYGISDIGGTGGHGLVFRVTSQGTFTAIYNFCTNGVGLCVDGNQPLAPLIEVGGNLYGTTRQGGTDGSVGGIAFSMPLDGLPDNSLVPLYNFCSACLPNGNDPTAGLVLGSDNNFYGTTSEGGNGSAGTVFQLTSAGTLTTLHDFCTVTNGSHACLDGSMEPDHQGAALVQGCDGNFYGVTPQGGGQGDGVVYKIDMGLAALSCTNTLGGGGGCTYSINPTNGVFAADGGHNTVSVIASNGCAWDATSNDGFITITSGSSGSGNGTVHYTVTANASTNQQVGTMTIAGEMFTVTEAGTTSGGGGGCTFTVSPTNIVLAAKGGKKSVNVKVKDTSCQWTAASNDSFITITEGANGTGSGKVEFSVPGNTNTTQLIGTMTIAGETVTVVQDIGGCTFKLSPKAGKLKSTGGTAKVSVKPNFSDCTWTATTTNSFITITSGSSGTGAGAVTYMVSTNATTNTITGTITIAGQNFPVTQAGAK